jgi:tetratricopeptide (TPR) repeat protein
MTKSTALAVTYKQTYWPQLTGALYMEPQTAVAFLALVALVVVQLITVLFGLQPSTNLFAIVMAAYIIINVHEAARSEVRRKEELTVELAPHAVSFYWKSGLIEQVTWRNITEVQKRSGLIFLNIHTQPVTSILVPLQAFASPDEANSFFNQAFDYWREAQSKSHELGECHNKAERSRANTMWIWLVTTLVSQVAMLALPATYGLFVVGILFAVAAAYIRSTNQVTIAFTDGKKQFNAGQYELSLLTLKPILTESTDTHQPFLFAGAAAINCGRLEEGAKWSTEAIKRNPDAEQAYTNRGMAYHRLDRLDDAAADFEKTIALRSRNFNAYAGLAHIMMLKKDYEKALALCDRAAELDPRGQPSPLHTRATIQWRMRRFDAANKTLDKMLAVPPHEKLWQVLGLSLRTFIYAETGRLNEALACINQVIEMAPELENERVNRGQIYLMMGRLDEAMIDLDAKQSKSQTSVSTESERYRLIALLHLLQGDEEKANESLKKAEEETGYLYATKALVAFAQKKNDEALSLLDEALEIDSYCAEAYWVRSQIHAKMGNAEEAKWDADKAREMRYFPYLQQLFDDKDCLSELESVS